MTEKKRMHWMPLDWPAYWADTRGFDAEKHGAYLMLLGAVWMAKGALPVDDELSTLACCTPERWEAIKSRVLAKFDVADGMLRQKRLTAEFGKAQDVSAKRRVAGKEGAAKRWQKDGKAMANAMANAKQSDRQEQKQTHSTNVEKDIVPTTPEQPKPKKGEYPETFEKAWAAYPSRPGMSKADSHKAWKARLNASLDESLTIEEIQRGVERYAHYCQAMETEPNFIKQPATFFGPGEHYLANWAAPVRTSPPNRMDQRTATMSGLGTPTTGAPHGTDRQEPIDVLSRIVPDVE